MDTVYHAFVGIVLWRQNVRGEICSLMLCCWCSSICRRTLCSVSCWIIPISLHRTSTWLQSILRCADSGWRRFGYTL